ncbi:MAG: transglutaminase domain-containing protein [Candidatus Xenobia bacterium]
MDSINGALASQPFPTAPCGPGQSCEAPTGISIVDTVTLGRSDETPDFLNMKSLLGTIARGQQNAGGHAGEVTGELMPAFPQPPAVPTQQMTSEQVAQFAQQRQQDLETWVQHLSGLADPQQRDRQMEALAAHTHDPIDLYLLPHGGDSAQRQTETRLRQLMNQQRVDDIRAGRSIDASLLPRLMVQRRDAQAFNELGQEVRFNHPAGERPEVLAHDVADGLSRLRLRTSVSRDDEETVNGHRKSGSEYSPTQTLLDAGVGNCGEWTYSTSAALNAAGLKTRQVSAAWEPLPGIDGLHNHGSAAYQDSNGVWRMVDPWKYGSNNNGQLSGFAGSPYAGDMSQTDWWAEESREGKPFMSEDTTQ